eukprot:GHVQ01038273.1.p1 GENE.GHVQ01038273.1~~GHVQ01038273.1.p1  ORF type:complete len:241 (-),score=54.63 GHVQ01038273.1:772-1494(-)
MAEIHVVALDHTWTIVSICCVCYVGIQLLHICCKWTNTKLHQLRREIEIEEIEIQRHNDEPPIKEQDEGTYNNKGGGGHDTGRLADQGGNRVNVGGGDIHSRGRVASSSTYEESMIEEGCVEKEPKKKDLSEEREGCCGGKIECNGGFVEDVFGCSEGGGESSCEEEEMRLAEVRGRWRDGRMVCRYASDVYEEKKKREIRRKHRAVGRDVGREIGREVLGGAVSKVNYEPPRFRIFGDM